MGLARPPYLHPQPPTNLINFRVDSLPTHKVQLSPDWQAYADMDQKMVYYVCITRPQTQWKYPWNHILAPGWERRLTIENIEHFVDTSCTPHVWHTHPRFHNEVGPFSM